MTINENILEHKCARVRSKRCAVCELELPQKLATNTDIEIINKRLEKSFELLEGSPQLVNLKKTL